MKSQVIYLILIIILTATASCLLTNKYHNIIIQKRVNYWYGEGDLGLAVNKYLLTGDTMSFYTLAIDTNGDNAPHYSK